MLARYFNSFQGIAPFAEVSDGQMAPLLRAGISYALACDWNHKYGPTSDQPVETSDARDLQHAILATAASAILVARDRISKRRLERAGVVDERFHILNFDEFVARVLSGTKPQFPSMEAAAALRERAGRAVGWPWRFGCLLQSGA